MELGVRRDPLIAESRGIIGVELRGAAEEMMRRDEPRLPFDIAIRDGVAQGQALELAAGVGEIAQIGRRKIDDLEALLRFALDESLLGEAEHAFAQNPHAGVVALGQLGVAESLAGCMPPGEDVRA